MRLTCKVFLAAFVASLCLLIPRTSQAFYNPSTGRWINRDPIEEPAADPVATNQRNLQKVQQERLYSAVMQRMHNQNRGDWASFLSWLREEVGRSAFSDPAVPETYNAKNVRRSSSAEQLGPSPNLHLFAINDPLQNVDVDGRYIIPTIEAVKDCNEKQWMRANKLCKKAYGCWSVVSSCKVVKFNVPIGPIDAHVWVLAYTCENTGNEPMG